MVVQFNNLKKQFDAVEDKVRSRIDNLFNTSQYILGEDVKLFENNWSNFIGCKYSIGVGSGTDAITLGIDTLVNPLKSTLIITQANTYIATIFGIINGLFNDNYTLHIIDCDIYGQISVEQLEWTLSKYRNDYQECVVVPVHMFGSCADMKSILELKEKYGFKILEDSAQAHGTITESGVAGNIGDIGAFSFYPGKNLGACGDGGMISTNSEDIYNRINRTRNLGSIFKHIHSAPGYNSRLDTIQAIILDEKLELLDEWNWLRRCIATTYFDLLHNTTTDNGCPSYCKYHTYHLLPYYTDDVKKLLSSNEVQFGQHYPHTVKYQLSKYKDNRYRNIVVNEIPIAEKLTQHITLPIHPYLSYSEIKRVVDVIQSSCIRQG